MKHKTLQEYLNETEKERPCFKKGVEKEYKKIKKVQEAYERKLTSIPKNVKYWDSYLPGVKSKRRHLRAFLRYMERSRGWGGIAEGVLINAWIHMCEELMK